MSDPEELVTRAIESVLGAVPLPDPVDAVLDARYQPWADTAAPSKGSKRPLQALLDELAARVAAEPDARAEVPAGRPPGTAYFDRFVRRGDRSAGDGEPGRHGRRRGARDADTSASPAAGPGRRGRGGGGGRGRAGAAANSPGTVRGQAPSAHRVPGAVGAGRDASSGRDTSGNAPRPEGGRSASGKRRRRRGGGGGGGGEPQQGGVIGAPQGGGGDGQGRTPTTAPGGSPPVNARGGPGGSQTGTGTEGAREPRPRRRRSGRRGRGGGPGGAGGGAPGGGASAGGTQSPGSTGPPSQ